jgi:hypothetical protein
MEKWGRKHKQLPDDLNYLTGYCKLKEALDHPLWKQLWTNCKTMKWMRLSEWINGNLCCTHCIFHRVLVLSLNFLLNKLSLPLICGHVAQWGVKYPVMLKFQDFMWEHNRSCSQLYVGMCVSENSVGASVLSPSKHPLKLPGSCKSDDHGCQGEERTNLCMGIPDLDKEILFCKTVLRSTSQGRLGSWTQESNGS